MSDNAAAIERAQNAIQDAVNKPGSITRRTPADLVARAAVDAALAAPALDVNVRSMPAPAPKPAKKKK